MLRVYFYNLWKKKMTMKESILFILNPLSQKKDHFFILKIFRLLSNSNNNLCTKVIRIILNLLLIMFLLKVPGIQVLLIYQMKLHFLRVKESKQRGKTLFWKCKIISMKLYKLALMLHQMKSRSSFENYQLSIILINRMEIKKNS